MNEKRIRRARIGHIAETITWLIFIIGFTSLSITLANVNRGNQEYAGAGACAILMIVCIISLIDARRDYNTGQ